MDAPQEAADEACGRTVALTLVNGDRPSFGFTLSRSKVEPYPKVCLHCYKFQEVRAPAH
jgi:hypothetical protein